MSMHTVWQTYQSMTRDRSVAGKKVTRSTVRRILSYARPYRVIIAIFLGTLILTSLLSVAQPLLFRRIVDDGISVGNATLVTWTAIAIAALAIADAGIGLVSRWYSSRIGEGLIYDLRTQVYDHVQRQSVAFFTRAQTGALISRLNSDVIGAQQAFTSTLGGVLGNLISVSVVLVAMFALSWQITVASLILVPLFLFVIPFKTLLSRAAKSSNAVMTVIASLVFIGVFIERLLFIIPVADMNPIMVVLALVALGGPVVVTLWRGVTEEGEGEATAH